MTTLHEQSPTTPAAFVPAAGTASGLLLGLLTTLNVLVLSNSDQIAALLLQMSFAEWRTAGISWNAGLGTEYALSVLGAAWAGVLAINVAIMPLELAPSSGPSPDLADVRNKWRNMLRTAGFILVGGATSAVALASLGSVVTGGESGRVAALLLLWLGLVIVDRALIFRRDLLMEPLDARRFEARCADDLQRFAERRPWITDRVGSGGRLSPLLVAAGVVVSGVAVHIAFVAQWLVRHMVRQGIPWTVFDPVLLFWPLWSLAAGLVVGLVLCHHGWLVATPSSTWVSGLVSILPAIGLFVLGGRLACFYADAPRRWAAFIGLAAPVVIGLIVWWLGSMGKGPASRLWIEGARSRRKLVEEAREHRRGLEAEQARLTLAPSGVERRVGVLRRLLRRLT